MALQSQYELEAALLRALGLESRKVVRLVITCELNKVMRLEVTELTPMIDGDSINDFARCLTKYELRPVGESS